MSSLILQRLEQRWECPACGQQAVTVGEPNRYHACPKMHGMTTPMVIAGTHAKVEAHEREDYIRDENVQLDGEGRPVMNVTVTRDEGQDVVVFAPTATAAGAGLQIEPPPIDEEALREAAREQARDAVERAIRKIEKERDALHGAEEGLELARAALAELEQD